MVPGSVCVPVYAMGGLMPFAYPVYVLGNFYTKA